MRDFHTLEELRGSLLAYVRSYNQRPHSSLKGIHYIALPCHQGHSRNQRFRWLDIYLWLGI